MTTTAAHAVGRTGECNDVHGHGEGHEQDRGLDGSSRARGAAATQPAAMFVTCQPTECSGSPTAFTVG
ncbi:MAG: hypothetical protein MAG471_01092 [Acidimicrobiaceae bacterium]|nr:hypothetical protein [Acidimicrobiaceae bacterium]